MDKRQFTFEEIKEAIENFSPCMNDYLYVFDISNDRYYISERAVERFNMPCCQFTDVANTHRKFVHPDDVDMLFEDLQQVISGEKDEHDIIYRWMGRDGHSIWINCRGRSIRGEDHTPQFLIGCINEVGIRPIADNVSGLLESVVLKKSVANLHENSPKGFIMRLGIDDFKNINEKMGISYGDYVLRSVAERIVSLLTKEQKVYRVVADEFMVVDYHNGGIEEAERIYHEIQLSVDEFIQEENYRAVYAISAGIISGEDIADMDYSEIMKISQFALSRAKKLGKNQSYRFQAEDYQKFLRKREILVEMRKSIERNFEGFELHFQPIVTAEKEELYAAESLLRYVTSEGERLSPLEFIPILEESGLIIPVGKWVLEHALKMCTECRKRYPDFKISVNLSYVQILKSDVLEDIVRIVEESGVAPANLIIEMTESGYVERNASVRTVWKRLREYGVWTAIDDFGTGYSNFLSISTMMPNVVKLDREFTVKAMENAYEYQLMRHIIQLVHSVNLRICVEGVETQEELERVRKLGADCIQGYYFSKPCPPQEFLERFIEQ